MRRIISLSICAALVCAVLGIFALTAGAVKTQTQVTSWNYAEEFDALPSSGFKYMKGNGNNCEAGDIGISVSDGAFVFENSEKVEYIVEIRDGAIAKCDEYIFEIRFKADAESGSNPVITFQNYMGNGFRIQSQVTSTLWRFRTADNVWHDTSISLLDGNWHVIRYEVSISDGTGHCDLYADGTCAAEDITMHGNNGSALIKVINNANNDNGKNVKLVIDYIKATPKPEQTDEPVTSDTTSQAPETDPPATEPKETAAPETTQKPIKDSERYQRKVSDWDYVEEFTSDKSALESGGWEFGSAGTASEGSVSVNNGNLVITNSGTGEYNLRNLSPSLPKKGASGAYILEIRFKTNGADANDVFGPISYLGKGTRVFTQFSGKTSRVRQPDQDGAKFLTLENDPLADGKYHVVRFEHEYDSSDTTRKGSFVRIYIDGEYYGTTDIQTNGAANTYIDFVTNNRVADDVLTISIDYIKVKAVSSLSVLSPDTGDGLIVPVTAAVACCILTVCVVKASKGKKERSGNNK